MPANLSQPTNVKKDVVLLFYPDPSPKDPTQHRVPYSLLYLERAIRDLGVEILLVDEQVAPDYMEVLERNRDRILLAGVSSLTGEQIYGGIAFSKRVRAVCDAPIVWGGWHATLLPEQTLREDFIDFVVVGQGERPLRRLVEHLRDARDVSHIDGLAYKRDGGAVVNAPGPFEPLEAFAPMDFGRIDFNRYVNESRLPERFLGYFASHGCPLDCTFCCVGKIYQRRWYHKPVARIIDELEYLKQRVGIDSFLFDDDNFFVNPAFVRELARAMIDAGLDLKWETSAHAHIFTKIFNEDDLELFARAGCRQIYVGAESGDQEVLDLLDKHLKVDETLRFVTMLKSHGITPRLSTMVCLPTDSGRDFQMTLDLIRRAKLLEPSLRASVFFYTPYPGTVLYDRAVNKGFAPPQRLADWTRHTLRSFRAPWAAKGLDWKLEYFVNFYLPLVDPQFYRLVRSPKIRPIVFAVNKLFSPVARLRFKKNFFRFPIEAAAFLWFLRLYNRLTGSNFCLGNGTYIN